MNFTLLRLTLHYLGEFCTISFSFFFSFSSSFFFAAASRPAAKSLLELGDSPHRAFTGQAGGSTRRKGRREREKEMEKKCDLCGADVGEEASSSEAAEEAKDEERERARRAREDDISVVVGGGGRGSEGKKKLQRDLSGVQGEKGAGCVGQNRSRPPLLPPLPRILLEKKEKKNGR
uniref:Uncharacterized protein n=1 Tax=Ananas comosus var. bracteatus TaxID=296719 RepID=A0A6V7QTW1_ANACO